MMSQFELSYTSLPVCPYCGHKDKDPNDTFSGEDIEFTAETECGSCEKEFMVSRNVEITYTTAKIEGDVE